MLLKAIINFLFLLGLTDVDGICRAKFKNCCYWVAEPKLININDMTQIILLDDAISSGAHIQAARKTILEKLPGRDVYAFVWAKVLSL